MAAVLAVPSLSPAASQEAKQIVLLQRAATFDHHVALLMWNYQKRREFREQESREYSNREQSAADRQATQQRRALRESQSQNEATVEANALQAEAVNLRKDLIAALGHDLSDVKSYDLLALQKKWTNEKEESLLNSMASEDRYIQALAAQLK
jgi:uncharacterized membrane protein